MLNVQSTVRERIRIRRGKGLLAIYIVTGKVPQKGFRIANGSTSKPFLGSREVTTLHACITRVFGSLGKNFSIFNIKPS